MAHSQDPADNPVAINVVPMVDVIFCLCVFFMCSMKWQAIEGRFDAWLPKDQGQPGRLTEPPLELRVALFWDAANACTRRQLGQRPADDDAQLQQLLAATRDDARRADRPVPPVIVDADRRVPWQDVVEVINLARREQLDRLQFAAGAPTPR